MKKEDTLKGLQVLVTRSSSQAHELSGLLIECGARPVEIAVIELSKPSSWDALDQSLQSISTYDWIVFASVNAVKALFERADHLGINLLGQLTGRQIAAIGPSTAEVLRKNGVSTTFQPSSYVAEQFVEEFPGQADLSGKRILWPRTNIGRTLIADSLREFGATVEMVEVYRTELPENSLELCREITSLVKDGAIQVITLASAQTAKNLSGILKLGFAGEGAQADGDAHLDDVRQLLSDTALATIGPVTSRAAESCLKPVTIEAREHTLPGLVAAISEWYQKERL
ncbi:MAG: uroporphyrinogen-III synthase [Cyanobacteria bacterium]|nr:uroporphyrinogen-III synthase [Cyanobacteriota bacterium]